MRKHRMPDMKEGGVNVTPLIDIVMCLIIFFMLVAKIGVTRGVDAHINLPTGNGLPIKEMGQTITLNIRHMNGHTPLITALVGMKDVTLSLDDVKVMPWLQGELTKFKAINPKASVILRGDDDLTYEELAPVLMEVAAAGITDTAYEIHDEKNK
jgi:biopolymer transport protein ExbD